MSISTSLDPVNVETARRLCGESQIVVVAPSEGEVGRYRLLRYSGSIRGKGVETFAVKDATDKFFVRSDRELGLCESSPYQAFLAQEFDSANALIDLTDRTSVPA